MNGSGDGGERVLLVTGKLAEPLVRRVAEELSAAPGLHLDVFVAKISVAALMTARWLTGKLHVPAGTGRVILPGDVRGDLEPLTQAVGVPVQRGPRDVRDLPAWLGRPVRERPYGAHAIEILAEINHADRLSPADLLAAAREYAAGGADVIDLGCTPGEPWGAVADGVRLLRDHGRRVSIDSFDAAEVAAATAAGAELVLSVNAGNRERAVDWGAEVVVLPDDHAAADWCDQVAATADFLDSQGVRYRLDPILEPIGFGLAASLERYVVCRRRFPEAALMMGVGNLTELTEVDSAGVNAVLIGLCAELAVGSVLTTQVIGWARSAVAEIDAARRLMHHAVTGRRLPKHVDSSLVMLRDSKVRRPDPAELTELQRRIRDPNFRLFATDAGLTALNAETLETDEDAFALFERLGVTDASHAFYLGWELMKATLARQLGKNYVQDRELSFGLLTEPERSHGRDLRE